MTHPSDDRLGIVRLPLPDGREAALQLTYAQLDQIGHEGLLEHFKTLQKGKAGVGQALGELLEAFTSGHIQAKDVMAAPVGEYPLSTCLNALWSAWSLAQYGPTRRPAEDGPENPPKRRRTWWKSTFGRRSRPV